MVKRYLVQLWPALAVFCCAFTSFDAHAAAEFNAPLAVAPTRKLDEANALNDAEKARRADDSINSMQQVLRKTLKMLEEARNEKDISKLNCVNEKLMQTKGLLRVAEQADIGLQEAVARKESMVARDEYVKISLAKSKVDQIQNEAQECVGQMAYSVDQKTRVEVEQPSGLPETDATDRSPPAPITTRPPPASQFER